MLEIFIWKKQSKQDGALDNWIAGLILFITREYLRAKIKKK